jgi:hypothetical protein
MKRYGKRLLFAALLPLCACGANAPRVADVRAQAAPEYQKLKVWVGDWTYEATNFESPLGPAGKSTGTITVRMVMGGYFVEWSGEDRGPGGVSHWREIDGYDGAAGKYFWATMAEDGSWQTATYSFAGNTSPYSGTVLVKGKLYKFRGVLTFAPDGKSFVDKREYSIDGESWKPLWEGRWTKVKETPA